MNHEQANETSEQMGEVPADESTTAPARREATRRGRVNLLRFLLRGKLRDISALALILVGVIAIGAVILLLVALIAYVVQRSGEPVDLTPALGPTPTYEWTPVSATVTRLPLPTASPFITATLTAPAPGSSAAPQVAPGAIVEVAGTGALGLRLRSGPGRSYVTTKVIDEGSRLEVLDGPETADDIEWWRLEASDGIVGWAASEFLEPVDDLEE
jgi:hypothetical protein